MRLHSNSVRSSRKTASSTTRAQFALAASHEANSSRRSQLRRGALGCVLTLAGVFALPGANVAVAGERQFLVILADSPKQDPPDCTMSPQCVALLGPGYQCVPNTMLGPFGSCRFSCTTDADCAPVGQNFSCTGRICVGGLVNPEVIRKQYFDRIDPNVGSFAEYWEEVSYGDVTISGTVTDWISLPWRIRQNADLDNNGFVDRDNDNDGVADFGLAVSYGQSEQFFTSQAQTPVDINGDPLGTPDGPFSAADNPDYATGGKDVDANNSPVWKPGERFVDMDGDGAWDGLDEARNEMDWDGDGQPDLLGPWIDLNEDAVPDAPNQCVYLPDSDNDGNADCCPNGPGTPGCEPFPAIGSCPPTTWGGPNGAMIIDCNGNLQDDALDIALGISNDRFPFTAGAIGCNNPTPNGIPDECEFKNFDFIACIGAPVTTEGDPCMPVPACDPLDNPRLGGFATRCEFDDVNEDGQLDIVEPFENFLRIGNVRSSLAASDEYITNNYPGDPDLVIDQKEARPIYAKHDPMGLAGGPCVCADGSPCQTVSTPVFMTNVCVAGHHAEFDPPDFWIETRSTKVVDVVNTGQGSGTDTPEPSWYRQAWVDRYRTEPPPWGLALNRRMISLDTSVRRCFAANAGGLDGDGTGWIGCDALDALVTFSTSQSCGFFIPPQVAFDGLCNARILPEEVRGLLAPAIFFDGYVEHDDLPSSKYHSGGDESLGEVTSPFSDSISGEDRGTNAPDRPGQPDGIIPAAGPYATNIHGNFGRDAGNMLHLEMLTCRTEPPFNNGLVWMTDGTNRTHPYAGSLGFRDFNLDGLVDQGNARPPGSESYLSDFDPSTPNDGFATRYPWNRRRLLEDCIEILDSAIDFDDFVDPVSLKQVACVSGSLRTNVPAELQGNPGGPSAVAASGVLSGIVLLPPRARGAHAPGQFPFAPSFYAIHNEDGLGDPQYLDANLPRVPIEPGFKPQINWNLFVHDLVICLDCGSQSSTIATDGFQTAYAAHEYMHTWERFPDLYDYDVFDAGAIENCPVGRWDIMAGGGLVHPAPILKQRSCTDWIKPVDLATVLTPGVDSVITLPPAAFVRDESYFFLENEDRLGERYYFWSAGSGFDAGMPGAGMLIQHTDVRSNLDAVPQQQRSADRPAFLITQADGNDDLQACSITVPQNRGDAGDVWPGTSGATRFNLNTVPSATWYTQNSWTGIDVLDVVPDGAGSVQLKINWVPTTIPSLRFLTPPAEQSVGSSVQVRTDATDVFGGTTLRFFYIPDVRTCAVTGEVCSRTADCTLATSGPPNVCRHRINSSTATFISEQDKNTPGTNRLTFSWNISGVTDGRYVLYAKLIPGVGADGTEDKNTRPRAGRNNFGDGNLTVTNVAIDTDSLDADDLSRFETWTAKLVDVSAGEWQVNSTTSQPVLNDEDPTTDAYPRAKTGESFTSVGNEVTFTIQAGSVPFGLGDTFVFTTTGFTPVSGSVTIADGQITEDPVAVIRAAPLAGDPPLDVTFEAGESFDPNGAPLTYRWDFGDGSPSVAGAIVQHRFLEARTFTVSLRATNADSNFGEAFVDVAVTNNSPNAAIVAVPSSGPTPLNVQFSASESSDRETPGSDLIYQWNFGDGFGANDLGVPGIDFQGVRHLYRTRPTRPDGSPCVGQADAQCQCTPDSPCTFMATLTVTDEGGKRDTATISIRVGNSSPVVSVEVDPLRGPAPLEVSFDASATSDPDNDPLTINWQFGDGESLLGASPMDDVKHTYTDPGNYTPTASVSDGKGSDIMWTGPVLVVTANQVPTAAIAVDPERGVAEITEFRFSASGSRDPDSDLSALTFTWNFGDGSPTATGEVVTHIFNEPRITGYQVRVTISDELNATDTATVTVIVEPNPGNQAPVAHIATLPSSCTAPCSLSLDARLSFDPDDDAVDLLYTWTISSGSMVIDTLIGAEVEKVFRDAGTFQIELTVSDGRGGVDRAGPVTILVMESGVGQQDPGAGNPVPGGPGDPPDSASQRPPGLALCGLGMVSSMFGSFIGLLFLGIARRRWR